MKTKRLVGIICFLLIIILGNVFVYGETAQPLTNVSSEEFPILKYGVDSKEVTELQTKLTSLFYYTGNISGRYREGTREA
ncbi:MAG: peptidoglycan-binding protein, partial [Clostridiales bacterium]|nr:peptidoglycan-binding protein [Clostridiales bacterium]